ncbi:hypothetical protein JCM8547_008831 [Rhodosporidiobolus lusitaniae]
MLETAGRRHGEEDEEVAFIGAREGFIRGTLIAGGLMALAQWRFPLVRRQTLAGRAFVVSWGSIFGMVIYADHYLLEWEQAHKREQEKWREAARRDLSSRGSIPTESAMRAWKVGNDARLAAAVPSSSLSPSSSPSPSPSSDSTAPAPTQASAPEQSKVLDELQAVREAKAEAAAA